MRKDKLLFFESLMVIVGSIIGAGVLGIPYVVSRVGFVWGLFTILILGAVVLVLHVLLGDVVARTRESLQLGGLVSHYLGRGAGMLMSAMLLLMGTAALIAYSIGMGESAYALFGAAAPLTAFHWGLLCAAVGSLVVVAGIKMVARVELIFASLVFLVIVVLIGMSMPHVRIANLTHFDWRSLLLPYGVILFAFHGSTAIVTSEEVLPHHPRLLHRAILISGLIPLVLYAFFAWAVVGVTGMETTPVATVGLGAYVGPMGVIFGNVFALFAMMTSFFGIGFALRRMYEWDLKVPRVPALLLTLGVPLVCYVLGMRNFIAIIGLAGALFGSIEAILIIAMYLRARASARQSREGRGYGARVGTWVIAAITTVFAAGGLYAVYDLFHL